MDEHGARIANRAIAYHGQLAGIMTAGLAETFDRDLPPVYSRWTLTWWLGTMLLTLIGAALMLAGLTWWGLAVSTVAFASCYSDARFGWWE